LGNGQAVCCSGVGILDKTGKEEPFYYQFGWSGVVPLLRIVLVIVFRGMICSGYGESNKSIALQLRFFKDALPEIIAMRHATINVQLETALPQLKYDFKTPLVQWTTNYVAETFSFLKAWFLPDADRFKVPVACLLYFSSSSPHRANPLKLEIITQSLDLTGVGKCFVYLKPASIVS
jgi:hypothetical protein